MAVPTDKIDELFDLDPAAIRCPYQAYGRLREEEPVRWVERISGYMVSRYADVLAVLQDPHTFSNSAVSGSGSVTGLARKVVADPNSSPELRAHAQRRLEMSRTPVLIYADPPEHSRQRKLVNKAFTARRIAALEPAVQGIVDDLLDAFPHDGEVELVSRFAVPLPMRVIATILGVPTEQLGTFKRWSDAFVAGLGRMDLSNEEIADLFRSVNEFYDYFGDQIADRRRSPRDDLLSAIVEARIDGETPLAHNEMLQMLVNFLVAGNETTTSLLGSTVFTLLTDADLLAAVRADPGLIPTVVEEVLRLETPIPGLYRTATGDTAIDGVRIPEGSMVYISYASANRDEAALTDPPTLKLDLSGEPNHLAFGQGPHFCLGAPLARLEARVGVTTLLARTPTLELACDPADVPYLRTFGQRALARLPVRVSLQD